MKTILLTVTALAALTAPAAAATAVPGTASGTDRTLAAACHYVRTYHTEYGDMVELTGVATSAPDTDVWITCTVTSRYGSATAYGSGFNHALASGNGILADGPTTICVSARADRTVDVQMYVDRCETYHD